MASGSYMQANVRCPYYISDDGKRKITCEGVIPDTNDSVLFRTHDEYMTQMEVFCTARCENCERYLSLKAKYDGE